MASETPAWMICEDIITRLKDELILEAIDILHGEMKVNRIDISGYVSLLPDKPNEVQKDMYIIHNLVQREPEIVEQYRPFLEGLDSEQNPDKVARAEELKKFMLSLQAISTLMRLSNIAQEWAEDTGKYSKSKDLLEIMKGTAGMKDDRLLVLDFVLSNKRFLKSEALTDEEVRLLADAKAAAAQKR